MAAENVPGMVQAGRKPDELIEGVDVSRLDPFQVDHKVPFARRVSVIGYHLPERNHCLTMVA